MCLVDGQFIVADDLWVISDKIDFESPMTFLARSAFYGPNSNSEIELMPIKLEINNYIHTYIHT